ncbi:hypothetical protein BMA10247_A2168 [Burkholderia mallei NCTC 10247]|uniref:Uncharacterized protein n=1 Tax=Burkholderia pseudomallei 1710a TaxID=320371 RepID=A0A0E1W108_BURPE|nr:hypothetical protein BMA10247_A2168 [Burkholderia mallei NCTC 10247]EET05991.1 hypothetical protein BURPS1710A_A2751 [Burkholderia pseudomallei 1710a]KOT06468.1 hypothetical protein DM77_1549 [Burkholderia mallei]
MTRSVRHRTRFAAHAGPCVRATFEAPGPFGNLFFIAGLAARIPFCTRSPGAPFDGTPSVRRRPERIRGRFSSLFSIPPIDAQSRRCLSQWRRVTQLC